MLIEQLINGLTLGSIYVVVALGYTLVFGVLNIVNMGHGEIFMFGAFMGVIVTNSLGLPLYVAFFVAIIVTGILGYFLERFALRPLRGKEGVSHLAPLISTIGVSIFLENAAHHFFGAGNHPFRTSFSELNITIGSTTVYYVQILIFIIAILLNVWTHVLAFENKSRKGFTCKCRKFSCCKSYWVLIRKG